MLIQFNFKNYKSYFDETSLDLTATCISELKSNLFSDENGTNYMKIASIYGANASGKSNILGAFKQMRHWVLNSFSLSTKSSIIPLKRFQFSKEGKEGMSLFEVFFRINNIEYQYGFELDHKSVNSEWLYKKSSHKKKNDLIFERENQTFKLNDDVSVAENLINKMNEKTLLLTLLSSLQIEDANLVSEWFQDTKVVNYGNTAYEFISSKTLPSIDFSDKNQYNKFMNFVTSIDLGIEGIRVEVIENDNDDSELDESNGVKHNRYKVFTLHSNCDSNKVEEILLSEESSGTIKMISLYSNLFKAFEKGRPLFIDELDAKLHPLLTRYIINMFQNSETNKNNAQLIFTTHDVSSLSNDLLRRDQILFVEKNEKGMSNLFSLAEYKINETKIRKDASYGKDYLYGRYGAIPQLKDIEIGE